MMGIVTNLVISHGGTMIDEEHAYELERYVHKTQEHFPLITPRAGKSGTKELYE